MSKKTIENDVQMYVLLPFNDYRSMDQRLKKADTVTTIDTVKPVTEREEPSVASTMPKEEEMKQKIGKDLTKGYQAAYLKKVLRQLANTPDSKEILELENINDLIRSALNNSKRVLPNEERFFRFIFQSGLSKICKNRYKINLYFDNLDDWYKI